MGLRSCRLVRVPMITPVHSLKERTIDWTMEQWKNVAWFVELHFILDQVDGQVHVRHITSLKNVADHVQSWTLSWQCCSLWTSIWMGIHWTSWTNKSECLGARHHRTFSGVLWSPILEDIRAALAARGGQNIEQVVLMLLLIIVSGWSGGWCKK